MCCVMLTMLVASCLKDELEVDTLTPAQQELIGRAVNFNVSVADLFATRATSYTSKDDGSFNQNDRMRIYRNYMGTNGKWETTEVYRTYYLFHRYAAGDIHLGIDWLPEVGRQGYDDLDQDGTYETFVQTAADSLTWENGRTLRFCAWSQSNYNNVLRNATPTYFYPDFCVADWVNASGPTMGIPLVLNHRGSRIVFKVLSGGNRIYKVELCADINADGTARADGWKDYKYADNADTTESDQSASEAGKTDEQAREECQAVTAVYQRMCMPAGVNMKNGTLKAVKAAEWNQLGDKVRRIEEQPESIFMNYGTASPTDVANEAKRPFFCGINGNHYLITIPYDISTGPNQGDVHVLPPYTRFRVYMYDVNNGDGYDTPGYEGKYHVFSLQDIVELNSKGEVVLGIDGNPIRLFPDGLKMSSGASYTFKVGYRYGSLYVVANKNLSWEDEAESTSGGTDEAADRPESTAKDYGWWKSAIKTAVDQAKESAVDYEPEFHIGTEKDFLEFIQLVNGTAVTATDPLYRLVRNVVDGQPVYGWSTTNSQYNPVWIDEADAEKLGYIFYDHYYPANADKAAHSERDYLKGPFPFYDDNLRLNFKVVLDADLDLKDWQLESIGCAETTPFMGKFDGGGHTLRNVHMREEYLFGCMNGTAPGGASITNLKIESIHRTALLRAGVNPIYLAGISLLAPSTTHSLAGSLRMEDGVKGTSYVVGCIHVGDAGGALVGSASDVNMFGCMQAAQGITGGALVGTDVGGTLKPQIKLSAQKTNRKLASTKPSFRTFMCNYYDTTLSPDAKAVGSTDDDYSLLEYVRGRNSDIIRARNDYLTKDVPMFTLLSLSSYPLYYGLAPWHAMNYAIWWYNTNRGGKHPCNLHYESDTSGYRLCYPTLESGQPTSTYVKDWNPIEQPN